MHMLASNPLDDIDILAKPHDHLQMIIKAGKIVV